MNQQICIIDSRYHSMLSAILPKNILLLPSVCCGALSEPIAYHPDMVLFQLKNNVLLCEPSVYEPYRRMLLPLGINLVQGKSKLDSHYPRDIAYNVLQTSCYAFAYWEHTDPQIRATLHKNNITCLSVAQGYSRCASLAVENGIITADPSIAKAAQAVGLSVLLLEAGHIQLPGYNYGFIGGTAGVIDKTVFFCGGLDTHPQGQNIQAFIEERGYSVCDMPGEPLTDIGTIFNIL
ncbi:MAG: hypothetical protein E7393_03320 [Ruminococcaceae bacterium]|nr:hypothetical protein [Oscillospiraceae bacterium]